MTRPLGVADFTHLEKLPKKFKGTLQTIGEIKAELGATEDTESLARGVPLESMQSCGVET